MHKGEVILLAAGLGAASGAGVGPIMPPEIALYWYCLGGAILGAIAAAAIPSAEEPNWRQVAIRIIGCAGAGFTIAPLVIKWRGWDIDPETVMGVSAIVGVLAWLGDRVVSSMTPAEMVQAALFIVTFGNKGKLPGGDDGRP